MQAQMRAGLQKSRCGFPWAIFIWPEHLAVAQVPFEWLGSHQAEYIGVMVPGDMVKSQNCY